MRVIYTPGCFDLFHVGHLQYLEAASKLGDHLIVGVASDKVIEQDKARFPIICQVDRQTIINALRCVYYAEIYESLEFLTHLEKFRPDVLVVSSTWGKQQRHLDAEAWVRWNNKEIVVLPYYQNESTSAIKRRILDEYLFHE